MKDPFGSSLLISSSNLAVQPLQRVFHKTTASYKFLWFLAILDLVREAGQVVGPIRLSIAKICTRMVANFGFRLRDLSCPSADGTKSRPLSKR